MNKLYISFVSAILALGIATSAINIKDKKYNNNFEGTLSEVKDYWKEVIGKEPNTPIMSTSNWNAYPNTLAFCWTQPGNKFISFNHNLINEYAKEYPEVIFQIILHEYTHCEANIGHVEMFGHFMNNGGAPWLNKDQVKEQFKDYVKYYKKFYNKLFREEEDLNTMYALILERDKDGKMVIKCPCKSCAGIK
jgi:hypothetical protein